MRSAVEKHTRATSEIAGAFGRRAALGGLLIVVRSAAALAEPSVASGLRPVVPVEARAAEAGLLARAAHLFVREPLEVSLGGYRLLTDTRDPARVERWRELVAALEPAWTARYGLVPLGAPVETIVLFERVSALRALQRYEPRLGAIEANGFTLEGLVALSSEGLDATELDGILQHELAHLLTRRSIGPALPAWLAEGLAEEFGLAPLAAGTLDFGSVRGSVEREGNRWELRSGYAAMERLGRRVAAGEVPGFASLAKVSELEFSEGQAGVDRYGAAFAWFRFLFADPKLAEGVRVFLREVARGEDPTIAALERRLGVSFTELETPFAVWVAAESDRLLAAAGVPRTLRLSAPPPLREIAPAELPAPNGHPPG